MDVTALDYVLLAVTGTLAVIGLFKGLSGWIGTLAGVVAAVLAGSLGFGYCMAAASSCPWVSAPFVPLAAAILDFLMSLVAFGIVRRLAARFFNFLLPQPLNSLVGMAGGCLIGLVLAVILAGTAFFQGVPLAEGFVASNSRIVHAVAAALDAHLEGVYR